MEKKKWIILLFLGLFLLPLMIGVVSAADSVLQQLGAGNLESGTLAKILLMALIAMLVYSISDILPFMSEREGVKWGISVIIAVLAFMFVPVDDIKLILANYEALGVMLTSIIPFVILMFFTVKLKEKLYAKGMGLSAEILSRVLILGFAVYISIKFLTFKPEEVAVTIPIIKVGISNLQLVYLLTLIISIIWLIFAPQIEGWIRRRKTILGAEILAKTERQIIVAKRTDLIQQAISLAASEQSNVHVLNRIRQMNKLLKFSPDKDITTITAVP